MRGLSVIRMGAALVATCCATSAVCATKTTGNGRAAVGVGYWGGPVVVVNGANPAPPRTVYVPVNKGGPACPTVRSAYVDGMGVSHASVSRPCF